MDLWYRQNPYEIQKELPLILKKQEAINVNSDLTKNA
jgi:hypothetical protein